MTYTQLKEVVECLKGLRPEMHDAAEISVIDEFDWAIEQIEGLLEEAENGGNPELLSQQCLHYTGIALRWIPQVARLIEWINQ